MHLHSPGAQQRGFICCCKPVAQLALHKILGIFSPFGLSISLYFSTFVSTWFPFHACFPPSLKTCSEPIHLIPHLLPKCAFSLRTVLSPWILKWCPRYLVFPHNQKTASSLTKYCCCFGNLATAPCGSPDKINISSVPLNTMKWLPEFLRAKTMFMLVEICQRPIFDPTLLLLHTVLGPLLRVKTNK